VRGILRRQHESRLGVVELERDGLHLGRRQSQRIQHHGHRIAAEHLIGEHIGGNVAPLHEWVFL
jgi:hypothetical protein